MPIIWIMRLKVKLMMDEKLLNSSVKQRISVLDANNSELNQEWQSEIRNQYQTATIETGEIGPFMVSIRVKSQWASFGRQIGKIFLVATCTSKA